MNCHVTHMRVLIGSESSRAIRRVIGIKLRATVIELYTIKTTYIQLTLYTPPKNHRFCF